MLPLVVAGILALVALLIILRPFFEDNPENPEADSPSNAERLQGEKENVFMAIRELEFDHQTGVVSDEDFRTLMKLYRASAVDLIKSLDQIGDSDKGAEQIPVASIPGTGEGVSSEAGPQTEATPAICTACGAENDPAHQFCTRCGGSVPDGSASTEGDPHKKDQA